MGHRRAGRSAFILYLAVVFSFGPARAALAEIFYDVAVKGVYEDNVLGVISGDGTGVGSGPGMMSAPGMGGNATGGNMMSRATGSGAEETGDFSINLFAGIGGSREVASGASLFLIANAQHTAYDTYTRFDSTIGTLNAGVSRSLGDMLSVRFLVSGRIKQYGDADLNSRAYGAALSFKEQLTPLLWLRQSYEFEQNDADSAFFTYQGDSVSIVGGYEVRPRTTLLLGYVYLLREFDEPTGYKATVQTVSAGVEQGLSGRWFLDAQYERQLSDSSEPGTRMTNNIYSAGLRYSY
jgi:hypothetical protein